MPSSMKKLIAGISYLNARPYFTPFLCGALESPYSIEVSPPAIANGKVLSGEAIGGLISSVVWNAHRDRLVRLPGLDIASHGPVESILLFGDKAASCVAVTPESATSVALLKILIPCRTYVADDPLKELKEGRAGGALLIGDQAIASAARSLERWDLGALWNERFGLPMVYAVFAVDRSCASEHSAIASLFQNALRWSREHLDVVIAHEYEYNHASPNMRVSKEFDSLRYLAALDRARCEPNLDEGLEKFCGMVNRNDI